jgi:hypothetical protein
MSGHNIAPRPKRREVEENGEVSVRCEENKIKKN